VAQDARAHRQGAREVTAGRAARLAVLLLAGTAVASPPPLHAQTSTLVHPGARVQVTAPVLGAGWLRGAFASARVRDRLCLGVAVEPKDASHGPLFVLLRGITALKVDRRTNADVRIAIALPEAADSDWEVISLDRLAAQDTACRTPAPATPR
jgi:hypothetical protein